MAINAIPNRLKYPILRQASFNKILMPLLKIVAQYRLASIFLLVMPHTKATRSKNEQQK